MYTLCTHCGITLHPEMLIAFSRSRQAHKCSQDKMSSYEFYLRHVLHYEQVNASRNRKVLELQHSPSSGDFRHGYVALPHCPMLWFSASHVRPTKPPLLLKQRSREGADHETADRKVVGWWWWLVGHRDLWMGYVAASSRTRTASSRTRASEEYHCECLFQSTRATCQD